MTRRYPFLFQIPYDEFIINNKIRNISKSNSPAQTLVNQVAYSASINQMATLRSGQEIVNAGTSFTKHMRAPVI